MFHMVAFDNGSRPLEPLSVLLAAALYLAGCQSATPVQAPVDREPEHLIPVGQYVLEPLPGKTSSTFDLSAFRTDVQKPALFDSIRRQAYLQNRPLRSSMCWTGFSRYPVSIFAKVRGHDQVKALQGKTLREKQLAWGNKVQLGFPRMIAQGLHEWLATDDIIHLERVSNEMLRWADNGGISSVVPDNDRMRYIDPLWYLREVLTAPIIAFEASRQQGVLTGDDLQRVHRWLANAMKMTDRGGMEGTYFDVSSHPSIHRGFVFMLWGAVGGDNEFFQKGFQEYLDQLHRLRPDGSTYWDVGPTQGSRALLKQNQVAGFLVMSAEIAANQGYDLYGLKFKGVGVHDAIKFLLDATENQSLVSRYSGAKTHDLRYISRKPSNSSLNLAWAEPYIARFWGKELADRLNQYVSKHRPAMGVTYGGNLTCLFAYF